MRLKDDLYVFLWRSVSVNNCNSYLIEGPVKILIDPGHEHLFGELRDSLANHDIKPEDIDLIIATHMHPDHIEAVRSFSSFSTMVTLSEVEYNFFQEMTSQNVGFVPDFFLAEGRLTAGTREFEIIHTPGHSPGSICIYWPDYKALFAGDVIFSQGVGRTDTPGGSGEELKQSINRLACLDVELLLSGHGDIIHGKESVARNFSLVEEIYFGLI